MDENNEQIQNAGDPSVVDPASSADPGSAGNEPTANQGAPDGSGKPQTAPQGNGELEKYKAEVRRLNRAIVEAKRGNRDGQGAEYTEEVLNTPEGQYAASLEIADGRLRGGLEDRLSLYPEISDEDKARIRTNPWAFASRRSWMAGDWQQALDEIELTLADKVDDLASQDINQNPQGSPQGQAVNVQGNPAPEPINPEGAVPGSEEDQDPWTMPMDKLERLADKQFQRLSQTQK